MTAELFDPADEHSPHLSPKAAARRARKAAKAAKSAGPKPLQPKNATQADYIDILDAGDSVVAIGPAGTGKTYIPARIFARALIEGRIEKIIITRVTVSDPRHAIGFLPGKLEQKMAPWLIPVMEGIRAEVSAQTLEQWTREGKFEIVPFEYMRGRTFQAAGVILDEAQNATWKDLKLILTRPGEGTQIVAAGDTDQVDIRDSGLEDVVDMIEELDLPVEIIEFTEDDVVRSPLAKAMVRGFRQWEARRMGSETRH